MFTKIRDVVDGAVYIRDFKKKANTEEYTSIRFVDNNRKILCEMEISRSGIVKIGVLYFTIHNRKPHLP